MLFFLMLLFSEFLVIFQALAVSPEQEQKP